MADYIPASAAEQKKMLAAIGLTDLEALFADIPAQIRLQKELDLPEPLSELELAEQLARIAAQNKSTADYCCFLGAGAYDHYIPAAVKQLAGRQEFYTAYTPYQPEISQGTLQAIFEYQTMICELTGLDVANASMYDGASALAEAALLAAASTRRKRLLVASSLHPDSKAVLATYARFADLELVWLDWEKDSGGLDQANLTRLIDNQAAAVILQSPNYFGVIEDLAAVADQAKQKKALFIVSSDPIGLGILQAPGEAGADIVVGDGQALGNKLNFGGPHLGFFAAREKFLRRMPGRIVGQTSDARGKTGYVLTIQTREQHIRREKATSNICTNQALNALIATIYLALLGPAGLARAAEMSTRKAHWLYSQLLELPGFTKAFSGPFFKEFTIRYSGDLAALNDHLLAAGFIGGLQLTASGQPDTWLLAVTEKRTDAELERFVAAVAEFGQKEELAG